jgi:hypothetical protein
VIRIITEIRVCGIQVSTVKELRMFSRGPIAFVSLFLALLLNPPAHAAERTPADLVPVQQGTLPIILTAPHGGRETIPGVATRTAGDKGKVEASRRWGGFDNMRAAQHASAGSRSALNPRSTPFQTPEKIA